MAAKKKRPVARKKKTGVTKTKTQTHAAALLGKDSNVTINCGELVGHCPAMTIRTCYVLVTCDDLISGCPDFWINCEPRDALRVKEPDDVT